MGMAAGQARLLSITARLTDNEMRSQSITNSKIRLADRTQEASAEYMTALSSTQLMYASYNDKGEKSYEKLTAGTVMTYSPLKNQYGLINTNNQILVLALDKVNYQDSKTLNEFLDKYGLIDLQDVTKDNPEWKKQATTIYGSGYDTWLDEDNMNNWLDKVTNATTPWLNQSGTVDGSGNYTPKLMTDAEYKEWSKKEWVEEVDFGGRKLGGVYGDWINTLLNIPENIGPKPEKTDGKYQSVIPNNLYEKFMNSAGTSACYNYAKGGKNCFMHVLADILGPGEHTTSNNQSFTIKQGSTWAWDVTYDGHQSDTLNQVREAIKDVPTVDDPDKSIYQKAVDLLWAAHGGYDGSPTGGDAEQQYLDKFFEIIEIDMTALKTEFNQELYDADMTAWNERYRKWMEWYEACQTTKQAYADELHLPPKTITEKEGVINDEDKADWYRNLWYRMGGLDDGKEVEKIHKEPGDNKYAVIDETKLHSAEWLQFALEQGIITMEQVTFKEEGSDDYPNLGEKTWQSCIYTSAADITEQDNQLAVTKAEVKYNQKTQEIQYQDKKYDQDLKRLDTEHNALQTEYESVKSVIDKNVERSFKAFS